jgi:hypothetical protein
LQLVVARLLWSGLLVRAWTTRRPVRIAALPDPVLLVTR